jgi:hypothetical protein
MQFVLLHHNLAMLLQFVRADSTTQIDLCVQHMRRVARQHAFTYCAQLRRDIKLQTTPDWNDIQSIKIRHCTFSERFFASTIAMPLIEAQQSGCC